MRNKSAIALFGMSGLLVLFATYASLLPDVIASKAEIEIKASSTEIITFLKKAENWADFAFADEVKHNGKWRIMLSGKESGEGSVLKWFSDKIGDGGLEIKRVNADTLIFERISDNNAFRDRGYFSFAQNDSVTKVSFLDSLDLSTNFMARYEAQDDTYLPKIDSNNLEMLKRLKTVIEYTK